MITKTLMALVRSFHLQPKVEQVLLATPAFVD